MHVGAATRVPGEPAAQSLRNCRKVASRLHDTSARGQTICPQKAAAGQSAGSSDARTLAETGGSRVTTIAAAGGIRGSVFLALRWFQAAACGALARSVVLQRLFRGENARFRARLHVLR